MRPSPYNAIRFYCWDEEFANNVTGLQLCRRMWCRKCYTLESGGPSFQVSVEQNLYAAEGDEGRLLAGWKPKASDLRKCSEARDGDDLMVPFECNFCVFA
jgi:hypothetical protein